MDALLFIAFGLAPSFLWLLFYLREDLHPEPRRVILAVFFFGGLATLPALLFELGAKELLRFVGFGAPAALALYLFLGIALIEEALKFLVVRISVYSNPELDEPVDIMIYMVVAALGFSALENIFVLFGLGQSALVSSIVAVSFLRFLGATFLHALSSAVFGFCLALSFASKKGRAAFTLLGLVAATLLHGFFDLVIMKTDGWVKFFGPLSIFILTLLFIVFAFSKLQKMKSTCAI